MDIENKANFEIAQKKALDLLQKYCLEEPPVIARELAECSGLIVVSVDFARLKPEYASISGFVDINSHRMFVNAAESPVRRNFTIAHELGHYLLGHTASQEYESLLFRKPAAEQDNPVIEQEANCFAANLLVPEQFLKKIIKKYPFASNSQLGNIFGVSEVVIRVRRKHLGV